MKSNCWEANITADYWEAWFIWNAANRHLGGKKKWACITFRDRNQHEVDIVLERANGNIIGVEVKASASVNPQDFRGLSVLAEFSGKAFEQGVLFYTGQEILPFKHGEFTFYALPIGLFLGAEN